MKRTLQAITLLLAVFMFSNAAMAGNKHKDRFCKIEPYVNSDYVYTPITAINYSFKATHAVLAVLWQIDKDTEYLRRVFHNDWPSAKTALQYAGKFSYFKVAARTFIPFMDKTSKAVYAGKVNFSNMKGGTTVIRADSKFDSFYKGFLNAKYYWGYFSLAYSALSYAALGTCKKIRVMWVDICFRKKKNCSADVADGDAILIDPATGMELASANVSQCSMTDDQKASKFVSVSDKYATDANTVNSIIKAVSPQLKASNSPAKRLGTALKPMLTPLKSMQKTLAALKVIMKPIKLLGSKLRAVLKKQICVPYVVPGVKKKCTKKKILGKKTKICVNKPTMEKKKACSKVEKVIGSINKLAKPIQKPMDKAIKALTNPIIKPLLKKMPSLNIKQLNSIVKKLADNMGVLAKLGEIAKKYTPSKLKGYTTRYKSLQTELSNIK